MLFLRRDDVRDDFGEIELDLIWPGLVISVDLRTGAMEGELFINTHKKLREHV